MKSKICNNEEEYWGLMKTLEKYGFRWRSKLKPTAYSIYRAMVENYGNPFPIKIMFGYFNDPPKVISYYAQDDLTEI